MKKFILFIAAAMLPINISFSQSQFGWYWQNPLPQGNNQSSIQMVDPSTIYSVGDYGMILKSTNGGHNWSVQSQVHIVSMLMDVSFVDANTGYTVGFFGGLVAKTTNGGTNWNIVETPFSEIFRGIEAVDAENVYIAAYTGGVLKTTNGGVNWTASITEGNANHIRMHFFDVNTGLVSASRGRIFRTTNAGHNWTKIQATDTLMNVQDIKFFDNNNGIACGGYETGSGQGFILRTTNGGLNWQTQLEGLPHYVFSASIISATEAIASAQGGTIYRTSNNGVNWYTVPSGSTSFLTSVDFVNSSTGMIVSSTGEILKTTNAGQNWSFVSSTISHNTFYDNHFFNSNTGIVVGSGGKIFRTINGGTNWNPVPSNATKTLRGLTFLNNHNGVAAGDTGVIITTTNGGDSWAARSSGTTQNLFDVSATGSVLYAVGSNGTILRSTDVGITWIPQSSGTTESLNSVSFSDPATGTVVGLGGTILRTVNGGESWMKQNSPVHDAHYGGVTFLNANVGYAVAENQIVIKTTNGGLNWEIKLSEPDGNFVKIFFTDVNTGTIVGGLGFGGIKRTTDGGHTWSSQFINITQTVENVFYINNNTGWAVGQNGLILKTVTGGVPVGVQQISTAVPEQFRLSQNYPNPFNPVSKIKFEIAQTSFTKLSVYDILGNRVSELVNEQLLPGSYEVEFDGSRLSSGVYFYTLSGGNFSETKKMLLVK